jgi:hypothetical protein
VAVGDAGDLPSVPLDAIPVISFETAPLVAGGNVVLGGVANGSNGLAANPWVKHGDTWWRYRVTKVDLLGALQPPPPAGKTPATWWKRASSDPVAGPSLALLSWIPTATPRAVTLGKSLTTTVTETWGTICTPVAEPAPVLWTFDEQAVGPSPVGWVLTGVPWPDAPGTTRSQPADLRATVTEPWRTGDKPVDLLQGTDPAIVIGDAVRCGRDQTRAASLAAVTHAAGVAATGAAATFGSMPSAGGSVQDAVDLIAAGSSLRDLPVAWAASAAGGATAGAPTCQGRILRSPVDDVPEPAPDGDPAEQELVKKAWSDLGFRPSELGSSVLLHADGGLASLDALLLVPRKAIERGLVARFRSADGSLLDEYRVRGSDLLSGTHTVPAHWVDASGPWLDPVLRAAQIGARVMAGGAGVTYVLVSPKVPDGTVDVEIGWDRTIEWLVGEAFWVVAVGATTAAEVQRHDWDTTTTSTDTDSATNAVEQDPDDHALLVPGQTYTVHVEWEAQQLTQDAQPAASYPDGYTAGTPQEFRFVADDQSKAPATLDPWLLSTAPAVGEVGFLLGEPLQVALATQKVTDLFDAYGLEVRIVVRSASGRHPSPPGGGAPGSAVTVPVGISGVLQAAHTGLRVMTPWQQTLTALLDDLPCVDASGSTTYHSVITLDYPLEPLTDYILDVYAVPKGSPADATGTRLHRVNFTTSRFSTVTELADLTRLTLVRDALVPTPAGLATLTDRPTGDQLDAAFQAAGLPVPQVPHYPAVTVLWSPDAVPQPVAVVVEGGEAFWRARPVPTFLTGLVVDDPTQGWWVAQDTDWLSLQTSASAPEAGDPPRAPVTRLVRGPGDTRAVVLLGPSARGTELVLDLVRAADPLSGGTATMATAVRVFFGSAPWEVAD